MEKLNFNWTLSHTANLTSAPTESIPATVPGICGLDYAKAKGYGPYYFGMNFLDYKWMEDEYFIYSTELDFKAADSEFAYLAIDGVDYEFSVLVDGNEIFHKEGMFSPSRIDVKRFSGEKHKFGATEDLDQFFNIIPEVDGHSKMDSHYQFTRK